MGTRRIRTRAAGMVAAGAVVAMTLSGCSTNPLFPTPTVHDPVVISFGYWGESGIFEADTGSSLEEQYESIRPWVDIVPVPMDYTAHHDLLFASLAKGEGAPTMAMVDEAFIIEAVDNSNRFVNLLDLGAGQYEDDYLAWKWAEAANADGSVVIGLGADVGGLALCYRKDLFEAAGLPSDRDAVSAAVGDSWEDFIAFGEQYVRAASTPGSQRPRFIDNAMNVLNPAIMQLGTGHAYYDRNDELDMRNVKPAFDNAIDVINAGLSSYYLFGQEPNVQADWNAALSSDVFAVVLCPSSMLAEIESQVPADFEGQWDIADIPGPGGNSGGSFYTIPNQGTENEQMEAYRFVEWLIQPEQQITIMEKTGRLPSLTSILEGSEINSLTNEFFNDAPYGEIFAKTVLDIPGPIYHSRCEADVRAAVEGALNGTQAGNIPAIDPWDWACFEAENADRC